ncbi:MAG: 16S rRNA (cytosine(1402)-N(4))-methyltransferase RsmH [Proteobacteria bacterium]|nr:16S rRNA (cytosine(1402)-N(4))-methyltransferase RsmH [Pseudomonadota bacterium]MCP4916095.1 16S rRNA (cytosine(1402)-N(4))-methyltransferase RsmH [Pseudomonadota bacterium]
MPTTPSAPPHRSVLLDESVASLRPAPGARFVDCTLGWGGHSEALLEAGASVIGVDRDPDALEAASARLVRFGDRFTPLLATFSTSPRLIGEPVDGVFADLGVSSPQLDRPERGFSFRFDAPLDMRMSQEGETAAELIERLGVSDLARVLRNYGEDNRALPFAKAMKRELPKTTRQLAELIERMAPRKGKKTHPATKVFQGLRIAVNDELGELEALLAALPDMLVVGGRAAIISFHSLEDRLVKRRFRELSGVGTERDAYGHPVTPPLGRLVHPKGLTTSDDNPRARSARLRVWEKT